ncbi:hypothetical protein J0904_05685 [Acinetobacter bereziniae]|uniref:hypothetical protein n=1 Tax=Acinetobacter bereziniae TaxID=106648 RepID=UPI002075628F|nr:hypothetical protein [Acinetobacter bereziniae]MCM8511578.1 hypothetical protein [Acinetobacter bereziniae]
MKNLIFISLFALLIPNYSYALTPESIASGIATNMGVKQITTDIRESISSIISQSSAEISKNQFEMRTSLLILSESLDQIASKNIDKTFNQLSDAEKQVFYDTSKLLELWNQGNSKNINQLNELTERIESILFKLPGMKNTPLVTSSYPLYSLSHPAEPTVKIDINGSTLNQSTPTLNFDNITCTLIHKDTTQLSFTCPSSIFVANGQTNYLIGNLKTYEKNGFFKSIFSKKFNEIEYKISIAVIPRIIGTLKGKVNNSSSILETQERSVSFHHRNNHCSGRQSKHWVVNVTEGWKIDPHSITNKSNSSRNSSVTIINKSEHGFAFDASIANYGDCGPFWKDARGSATGAATYTEYRQKELLELNQIIETQPHWGTEVIVYESTKPFDSASLELIKINGEVDIITQSENRPWYDVELDKKRGLIIFRPKSLSNALSH